MDTGQLATSITAEATSQGVTIGTNKAYGAIHHFGGQAGRNKKVTLPARPCLVVQEGDYEEIQKAAEEFFGRITI
jgi:phage virion morphogenesis protein